LTRREFDVVAPSNLHFLAEPIGTPSIGAYMTGRTRVAYLPLIVAVTFAGGFPEPIDAAENWPQWRGPDANGVAAAGEYPIEFSNHEGVAWKVALAGRGSSTPAVWDDSIFVTGGIDGQDGVVCYDFAGHEQWRRTLGPERAGKHRNGSGSNPSPVTDGQRVVVYYKSGTVACFDIAGQEIWRRNLQQEYGPDTLWWDLGTSPVLAGDRVIIAVMQEGDSFLVALDLGTGDVLWHTPRQYDRPVESDHAYTTPSLVRVGGRDVVVAWGADHLTGHDVATGELVWDSGGFNPEDQRNWRPIASAAVGNGLAVVPYGRGEHLAAVRLDGNGDVTESHRVWDREQIGADVPTPVVDGDRVIVLSDSRRHPGIACLELATGNEIWSADVPRNRNNFYASPVLAGDTLYCAREDGVIFVGRVRDDGFEMLAENDMGERVLATPIPIRGGLLIRGEEHLFRIEAD
jgi:outer membrane protein assembly factor BamB